MMNLFDLVLKNEIQYYWNNMIANIGTENDIIPIIFQELPLTGPFGANQQAIGQLFVSMNNSESNNYLNFLLQFPQNKAKIPSITIENGPEEEIEFIGSEIAFQSINGKWQNNKGGVFNRRYAVGAYTFNADETMYLYYFIKYFLIDYRTRLKKPSNISISARELAIDVKTYELPVVYRYIDLTVEGIIDTVVQTYPAVTGVTVARPTIEPLVVKEVLTTDSVINE